MSSVLPSRHFRCVGWNRYGTTLGSAVPHLRPVGQAYANWPAPHLIISDGAYGIGGRRTAYVIGTNPIWPCGTSATLGNDIVVLERRDRLGVRPLLSAYGWGHVRMITWDNGVAHIVGKANGAAVRRPPTVTEVCVPYERRLKYTAGGRTPSARQWLYSEWARSLRRRKGDTICGLMGAEGEDPMPTMFRPYGPDQPLPLAPDMHGWLPEGHLVHYVSHLADGPDLTAFHASYEGDGRRDGPYGPRDDGESVAVPICDGGAPVAGPAGRSEGGAAFRVSSAGNSPSHCTLCELR